MRGGTVEYDVVETLFVTECEGARGCRPRGRDSRGAQGGRACGNSKELAANRTGAQYYSLYANFLTLYPCQKFNVLYLLCALVTMFGLQIRQTHSKHNKTENREYL